MNDKANISDEHLNAFIDNQLDVHEKSDVLDALRHDSELSHRRCELQKVQDLMQLTYQIEPGKSAPHRRLRSNQWSIMVAACLALAIGLGVGWYGHQHWSPQTSLLDLAQTIHSSPGNHQDEWKILLHVSSNDPLRFNVLLDETEQLLQNSLYSAQKLQVEILTNSKGLELVKNNTRHADRIATLQQRYDNLVFSACNQALKRVQKDQGIAVELLPGTRVVKSAIGQVLKRQKQGWTYLKI